MVFKEGVLESGTMERFWSTSYLTRVLVLLSLAVIWGVVLQKASSECKVVFKLVAHWLEICIGCSGRLDSCFVYGGAAAQPALGTGDRAR